MEMKPYSQMIPRTRKQRLLDYNKRVHSTPESIAVMKEWNLDLDRNLIEFEGHRLKAERLLFGENRDHEYVLKFYILIEIYVLYFHHFFFGNSELSTVDGIGNVDVVYVFTNLKYN